MNRTNLIIALISFSTILMHCTSMEKKEEETFDIVISNGLVMDPESGLNEINQIGITAGKIVAISQDSLIGKKNIDATGLVVSPGFIDLHAHGQNNESFELMIQDGVTTAFELEVGTWNVDSWYKEREGGQILNYGISVGHIQVRMQVMGDESDFLPSGPGGNSPTTEESLLEIKAGIEEGLSQGAVGIGFGLAYTPAATSEEFEAILELAAEKGAPSFIHLRGGISGLEEAIKGVENTGAPLHIVHVNSSGGALTRQFISRIEEVRLQGLDISTEAYPYEAGMTMLESALFDDWPSWEDNRFGQLQWVETGEFLTKESLPKFREQGGAVIIHDRTEEMTLAAIDNPFTMIASDGFFENGKGHPRTSGTYSKILRKYVREKELFSLMDALARMTIEPARRLDSYVTAMKNKGRIKVGADADITVFNPETVTDRSTYSEPANTSEGILYVLVNGILVVENDELIPQSRPGLPVRKSNLP